MLEVPDLGDPNHETWATLIDLGRATRVPWTLIGAHMVAAHAWMKGRELLRTTRDADILVNVRAVRTGIAELSDELLRRGFEFAEQSRLGQGFTFEKAHVAIDLLAPDGLGHRARLDTAYGARTVMVPGGGQALARTGDLSVRSRGKTGVVPIPNLLGAILVTARAIAVDDAPRDKRGDAALLLSLVDDPAELATDISSAERGWLREHPYFADPHDLAWEGVDDPALGASAFLRIADLPSTVLE